MMNLVRAYRDTFSLKKETGKISTMSDQKPSTEKIEETRSSKSAVVKTIPSFILTAVLFPLVFLGLGGNWRWVEGWIFALWFHAMVLFNIVYLLWKDPALLAERSKRVGSDNQKKWDKYLLLLVYALAILWFVIMPLDAERFHWSPPFPLWLKILGGLALVPAYYLIEKATIDNTFLSTKVRIQSERKQQVITTGTYAFVRHPLYLGCFLMMLGAPLMLGSVYGLLLSVIGTVGICFRIAGEEKMLSEELEGYEEYKMKIKYRLIPYIW
jgi:protein-S-isoprenylcysteine O-methyltransferase Ste14